MKPLVLPVLSLATLLVAGCSSTPTHVDTGSIHASTFSFIRRAPQAPGAAFADDTKEVNTMVQDAITTDLTRLGLTKVPAGGDITVAYLIIVGNNVTTASINDYFGYGRDAEALHKKAQEAYSDSRNPNYFEAGTLLIDILDGKTAKLLRRTYVVRPILSKPSTEERASHIQGAVDQALQGLSVVP